MALSQLERILVSAQLIKVHEGTLKVRDLDLVDSVEFLAHNQTTHIEYSIALVEVRHIKELYVIFPGSNDGDDWLANFRFRLQGMIYQAASQVIPDDDYAAQLTPEKTLEDIGLVVPHADKEGSEGWSDQRVHSGFMRAYHLIEDQAMSDLQAALDAHPTLDVYGTAHSLGSAMLRFMMLDASYRGMFENRDQPHLYTYGGPRMGNAKFCKSFLEYVPNITRLVHNADLVVRLPLPIMGYRHTVEEYFIGERKYFRFYYKQDIQDHFLEKYIAQLEHLRGVVAQNAKTPLSSMEQGSVTS